jgi:hypothetical protein
MGGPPLMDGQPRLECQQEFRMLDAYIIEEIERRERERQRRERARPVLEVPRPEGDRESDREKDPSGSTVIQVEL